MSLSRTELAAHIRRQFAKEEHDPPIPRKYGDIPISYAAMTPEWLTLTLNADGGFNGAYVKSFSLGPKDNGTSNRRRVYLEWEGKSDAQTPPPSVFCKGAHALLNRLGLANGGTRSEITFYNKIRPQVHFEAPTAYFASYDPDSYASMMMLHDMESRTEFCTHRTELSKEQMSGQFRILAQLHGQFYKRTQDFVHDIGTFQGRMEGLIETIDFESAARNGFRDGERVIPPSIFAREEEVWPLTLKAVERNAALPETLIHGDVHLGNWYITPGGNMGLTDWAVMSRGHWSRDLAYVLGTGVPTDKRRLWEQEAVRIYLSELAKAGGPEVTEEDAWLELRRASFLALAYWTVTLSPSALMPEMQTQETSLDFIGRITALMEDHDVFEAFRDI